MLPGLLLWKDNQYLFKSDISLKEMKLGTIEIEYEKKLSAAASALELSETELAKARSEKESADKKVEDLEHTQGQLTNKIERQETECSALRKKLAEAEKSLSEEKRIREDDLRSYQRMVGGFLRAFKSETRRVLQNQRPDLDLSELEEMTPSHLARVAKEEEDARKSASEQRKKKKKKTKEMPPTESSTVPSLQPEGSAAEATTTAEATAETNTVVSDDPVVCADVIVPESGADV